MASCSLPYIESKFRQSNPDIADKLNNQHIKIVQDAVDSNLFRFKDRQLLFSQEGTKKLDRQRDYVSNINQQYGVNVLKNVDGVLAVNVLGLAPSTSVSQVKEGVDFVFEQNPELASIGTQEQYSQYLSTIFKTSKVKDIVYHGTDSKFDTFSDEFLGKKDPGYKGKGFYFWHGKKALEGARHVAFAYLNREITSKDIKAALINLKNPKEIVSGDYSNTGKILEGFDGAIEIPYSSEKIKSRKEDTSEVMVKSASQIHILGSRQDIEGFKNFVKGESSSNLYQSILNTGVSPEEATRLYNQTKTPEFKEWFGNSVVKDENGEPLLVYHGTQSKENFDTFKAGSSTGMFFTDDKQYAADVRGGRVVGPFFLKIEKPIEVEEEIDNDVVFENKDKGDGIIGVDYGQGLTSEGKTFVVYNPNQIKSLNNTGQFSESHNIYLRSDIDLPKNFNVKDLKISNTTKQKSITSLLKSIKFNDARDTIVKSILSGGNKNILDSVDVYTGNFNTVVQGIYLEGVEKNGNIVQPKVVISEKLTGVKRNEVLLHEIIHAYTIGILKMSDSSLSPRDLRFKKDILNLYQEASYNIMTPHYGLSSPTEFVAEALSNKEFRNALKRLKTSFKFENKQLSGLEKFIDALLKLFGLRQDLTVKDKFSVQGAIDSLFVDLASRSRNISYKQIQSSGAAVFSYQQEVTRLYRIEKIGAKPQYDPNGNWINSSEQVKEREKYFGRWFTKDITDIEWYQRHWEYDETNSIIKYIDIPNSELSKYQDYDKKLSRKPEDEFVLPQSIVDTAKTVSKLSDIADESPNIYYQQTSESNIKGAPELDAILKEFMAKFGVKFKDIEDFKNARGLDILGVTDILNKVIYLAENRKIDTLPEEVGHMITMLMGNQNPLIKQLMDNIEQWSEYQNIYNRYKDVYKTEEQIRFEAVGKLLAKHIVNEFQNSQDKSLFKKIVDAIKQWVQTHFSKNKVPDILSLPAATIASKIIKQDSGLISYKPRYNYVKLDADKAFRENPFEKSVHNIVASNGGKLTGSLAIAAQADIFRDEKEPIHDLDYSFNDLKSIANTVVKLKELGGIYIHTGISNKDSTSFGVLVPKPDYEIVKYGREKYGWKKGTIVRDSIIVRDKQTNKYYKYHESLFVSVDLFLKYSPMNMFGNFERFDDVMAYKQMMNTKSDVFFRREKDQIDYVLLTSDIDVEPKENYTYYQVDDTVGTQELVDDLNEKYADNAGIIFDEYVSLVRNQIKNISGVWLKASKDGYYIEQEKHPVGTSREALTEVLNKLSNKFGIQWRWDTSMKAKGRFENGIVYINPNKATMDTAFHEFAHPFLLVLKQENRPLYNRLVREIQKESKILERTKRLYPNLSGEELLEEAIVQSIGLEAEKKVYQGLVNRFIEWIKDLVNSLVGIQGSALSDVANMLTNKEYRRGLEVNTKDVYYQIDEADVNIYKNQIAKGNSVQKEIAERMLSINREIKLSEDGSSYLLANVSKPLVRVSDELKKFDFYNYNKETSEENKRIALERGNAVDAIMRDVLLEQELSDTSVLGEDISRAIYEDFKEVKESYPDAILLPQITFYNTSKGVAGTADVVAIHKDGQVEILDVKTSKYDFYTKSKSYPGKKHADSYDMHDAQLTMYKALAESMGFKTLNKGGLKVIPVKWTIVDDQVEGYTRPQMFIEHGGVEKLYEIYNEAFEESQFKDIMGNLKKILQAKVMKAKKEGKGGQASVLESILEDIKTAIDVEGVTKFVNEAFNTFYGTDNFPGYYNIYKSYLDKVGLEEDPMDMLAKIHEIEQMVELYKDSIDSLWQSYLKFKGLNPLDDFQDDSTLSKIDKLRRLFDDMENGFQERIPRVVASVLAKQVSPEVVEAIKTNIKSKQRAKFEKKDTSEMGFFAKTIYNFKKGQSEKTARKLKELEDQFLNDKGEVDVEEAIYREIRFGGYKDVGIADRWFSPGVSMPNTFLPTFILTVKRAFEEVRLKNVRFIPKAYEVFNKFANTTGIDKDKPHKFNEGLYTTRTIYREGEKKNVLVLSSSIDYSSYNSAKNEIWQSTEETKEGWNKRNKWMVENTQVRPSQHIEGVTKIGNLVLIETVEELENRKKKELGQKGFENWKKNNVKGEILWGDYRIPKLDKYKSSDFENVIKDKNKKEYYTFLLSTYLESQNQLPPRREEDKFILPFIDKSSNDRIREGGFWDTIKYKGKDMFMLMEEDILKENVERDKTIPVLYYNSALTMDAKDVSNDLLHSILRFKIASDRYAVQNKYQPLADNLLSLVDKTAPVEEDAEGFKLLDKAAKAVGITDGVAKYVKKHGANNTAAMLEAFIDTQIYGIARLDKKFNIGGVTVDTGKIANTLMNFASVTQIAFDPLTSVANSLNAQVQIAEEAFAGQFIDKESWLSAQAIYNTHEMDFIKDSLSPYNKSFLGTLTDVYDAMQGEYVNAYGHKVSKSAFKSKQNLGEFGYALMHKGEHRAAVTMMIALLKNKKVGDKSLYDIHKEQFEKTGNIDLDFNMQSRLHAINKRLHGVYNSFDAPELQRYAIGRLLIMYRKFLPTFLKRRFKAEGLDYELGDFTEGMYRTFYKKLFTDMKGLVDAIRNKQGDLTPYELYNLRRAFAEHAVIFITGLMAYALMHLQPDWEDDDDLQKYAYSAVLYQVLRVNAELSIGFAVGDINDYFLPDFKEASSPYKTTTAAYGVLIKLTKLYALAMGDLVSLATGEDIARYQRDTGLFEKGDSKTVAALLKLWGISGKNLSDEMMLNTLMLTKGVEISK